MSIKNFSPFGPAVLPAIGNIYINVFFYYIDIDIEDGTLSYRENLKTVE